MSTRSPLGRVETCSRIALLSDTPFVQPNGFRAPGQALSSIAPVARAHTIGPFPPPSSAFASHVTRPSMSTSNSHGQKTVCLQGFFATTVHRRPSCPCDADAAALAIPPSEGRFTVSEIFLQKFRIPPRMAIARCSKHSAGVPRVSTSGTTDGDGASPPRSIRSWCSGRRGRERRPRSSSRTSSPPPAPLFPRRPSPTSSTPPSACASRSVSAWFSTPRARLTAATACLRCAGRRCRAVRRGSVP